MDSNFASLNHFNFFFGKLEEGEISYRFCFKFNGDIRNPFVFADFIISARDLGLETLNGQLFNENFYGILAYSIIPFMSIHEGIDKSELVTKLTNPIIRTKCGTVI